MQCHSIADHQIFALIQSYTDLRTLPDLQNEVLDRLTDSIFQFAVGYISRLVVSKSETAIDIHLLANDATYDFLDRYLISRPWNLNAEMRVLPLLKKIARSKVLNAIRDNRRRCRNPHQAQPDGDRIVHLKSMESVEDTRARTLACDTLVFNELVIESERIFSDPNQRALYRLMIDGLSTLEIATRMNWDQRTAQRIAANNFSNFRQDLSRRIPNKCS